jgi:uncharacterized protein YrrD
MKIHIPSTKRASLVAMFVGIAPTLVVAEMNNPRANRGDSSNQEQTPSYRNQPGQSQTQNQNSGATEFRKMRQAADDPRGSLSGELIGMDVLGSDQTKLGAINDFVVDARSGRVLHAVVASGGVLGVGANLRVVPIGALGPSGERMAIDINSQRWEQAPVFTKDQLPSLGQDARGQQIHDYFGQKSESQRSDQQLALVTDLRGKDIRGGDNKIGEIEDVIISLKSRRAGALVDLSDDFFAGDQKFVVPLNRFSNYQQSNLRSSLTREDFARVAPRPTESNDDWDMGSVFAWPHGGADARRTGDRVSDAGDRARSGMNDMADTEAKGTAPVAAIQRAVQADARSLGVKADSIQVRAERDKVVLRGTVPSEAAKDRIENGAERAAAGWDIDNQLKVSSSDDM